MKMISDFYTIGVLFCSVSMASGVVYSSDAQIVNPFGWNQADPSLASLVPHPNSDPVAYLLFDRQFILTDTAVPGSGLFLLEVTNNTPTNFTFTYQGIAESYSLYRSDAGDIINADYVNAEPSFVNNWNDPGVGNLDLALGESIYIGYFDANFGFSPVPSDDYILYGWARVTNLGGELAVEESATALGGGIIVGTTQQIPEPSTFLLSVIGLFSLSIRRR